MIKDFSSILKNEKIETAASLRSSPAMGEASAWTAAEHLPTVVKESPVSELHHSQKEALFMSSVSE